MQDKGPMILAVCWTFTVLALLFVLARLFVRVAVHRTLFIDDYFIILSIVSLTLSFSIASLVQCNSLTNCKDLRHPLQRFRHNVGILGQRKTL
jgi:hypothetical protein